MSDRQWSKKHPSDRQARGQNIRLFVATTCIAADRLWGRWCPGNRRRHRRVIPSPHFTLVEQLQGCWLEGQTMTTLATTSSLREGITPEAHTRARRRLLTAEPNPTRANTPTSGSLTDDQLRVLAASDWAPPRMTALDASTLATADSVTAHSWTNRRAKPSNAGSPQNAPTAPTTTREQDTTPSVGESPTTTTTATTTSREPPSAQPTQAS